MPIDRFNPKIPFVIGESLHKNVPAGQQSSLMLSAGRWSLSPRSTVPYATVEVPGYGVREMSWGQVIEIPDGSQGIVLNSCAHSGDLIFDAAGTGHGFSGTVPATITVPSNFYIANPAITLFRSMRLDTRRARRSYLCVDPSQFSPLSPAQLSVDIYYQANRRGRAFSDGSAAALSGFQLYSELVIGSISGLVIPLGFASGQTKESAPGINSLQEIRPMALLDSLFVEIDITVPGNAWSLAINSYFLLEY